MVRSRGRNLIRQLLRLDTDFLWHCWMSAASCAHGKAINTQKVGSLPGCWFGGCSGVCLSPPLFNSSVARKDHHRQLPETDRSLLQGWSQRYRELRSQPRLTSLQIDGHHTGAIVLRAKGIPEKEIRRGPHSPRRFVVLFVLCPESRSSQTRLVRYLSGTVAIVCRMRLEILYGSPCELGRRSSR